MRKYLRSEASSGHMHAFLYNLHMNKAFCAVPMTGITPPFRFRRLLLVYAVAPYPEWLSDCCRRIASRTHSQPIRKSMRAAGRMKIYRDMSQAELNAGYNNLAAVAESRYCVSRWPERSKAVRARSSTVLDIRYGDAPRCLLDYFPCGVPDAPLFIFFHGGYWLRNHKDMFSFIAEGHVHMASTLQCPAIRWLPGHGFRRSFPKRSFRRAFWPNQRRGLAFVSTESQAAGQRAGILPRH